MIKLMVVVEFWPKSFQILPKITDIINEVAKTEVGQEHG